MRQMREVLAEAQSNQSQNQSASLSEPDTPWWMSPLVLLSVIGVLVLGLVVALMALRRSRVSDRDAAADQMIEALSNLVCEGVPTTVPMHLAILRSKPFRDNAKGLHQSK